MSSLFGRVVEITTGPVKMNNTDLDIEFVIPFDDDLTPNISAVSIYNLTKTTINQLKEGQKFTITAGYKSDKGIILDGEIESHSTIRIGADKLTTIQVIDGVPYDSEKTVRQTYKKNIKADAIIKDLAKRIGLKIAAMRLPENKLFKRGHTVDGEILQSLQYIARDCGASCYISRGHIYIRPLKDGDDHHFKLNKDTGLIGSPEYFQDKRYTVTEKGYRVTSLLQFRMNTASVIHLESADIKAKLRVRKGSHICKGDEFYTKVEGIM